MADGGDGLTVGVRQACRHVALVAAAVWFSGPLVWVVLTSVKPAADILAIPPRVWVRPTLEWYTSLWTPEAFLGDLRAYLANSLLVALAATGWSVVAGLMAAYALSRLRFRGKAQLAWGLLLLRMLPPLATAVPLFVLLRHAGAVDTRWGLSAVYAAVNLPFLVWLLKGFLDEVPRELDEAAWIDGCPAWVYLTRVLLPVAAPGVAACAGYSFLIAWNEFPLALLLTARRAATAPVYILNFVTDQGVQWGPLAAAATVLAVPAAVFVLLADRPLRRGLFAGAFKG